MTAARVQEWEDYLTRHEVGAALEAALAKLLAALPDQPFPALAKILSENPSGSEVQPAPDTKTAKEYLRTHMVQERLEEIINEQLRTLPPDPMAAIAGKLATLPPSAAPSLSLSKIPLSHTAFSWAGGHAERVPEGHTPFSWRRPAVLAATGGGGGGARGGPEGVLEQRLEGQLSALDKLHALLYHTRLEACKRRMWTVCVNLGLHSPLLKAVPEHYYSLELDQRRALLSAPSTAHLCKTIILENTVCTMPDCFDPNNSRYYGVVVQYEARLHADKLLRLVRSWNPGLAKSKFNFQLCPHATSEELSGYKFNAVAPLGLATPIPIILSHKISQLEPRMFWMGGGHPDLKLGLGVGEFVERTGARIADATY